MLSCFRRTARISSAATIVLQSAESKTIGMPRQTLNHSRWTPTRPRWGARRGRRRAAGGTRFRAPGAVAQRAPPARSELTRRDRSSQREINGWLNRKLGITSVEKATLKDLERSVDLLLGTLTAKR